MKLILMQVNGISSAKWHAHGESWRVKVTSISRINSEISKYKLLQAVIGFMQAVPIYAHKHSTWMEPKTFNTYPDESIAEWHSQTDMVQEPPQERMSALSERSRFIASPDWVQSRLSEPGFKLVDASWYLPAHNRDPAEEFASGHLPGAVFFDQDAIADHSTGLPHSIPQPDVFKSEVEKLGISDTDTIVVYDGPGIFTSPRVWWLFRLFGASNVYVLDGGHDGWRREGRPLETAVPAPPPGRFNIDFTPGLITTFEAMQQIVAGGTSQVADARGAGRFTGEEPEPRKGMRSGHMPGAKSLPSGVFAVDGKFKSLPELKETIEAAGIDLNKPVVTTCGSGVTAAIISLALESLGHNDHTLYDGSWSEWGARSDTAVATGKE